MIHVNRSGKMDKCFGAHQVGKVHSMSDADSGVAHAKTVVVGAYSSGSGPLRIKLPSFSE